MRVDVKRKVRAALAQGNPKLQHNTRKKTNWNVPKLFKITAMAFVNDLAPTKDPEIQLLHACVHSNKITKYTDKVLVTTSFSCK